MSTSFSREKYSSSGRTRFQVISSFVDQSAGGPPYPRFVVYMLDFSAIDRNREAVLKEKYELTRREIDIVQCVCRGLTNGEIGQKLYISRFTVETHLKNIFDKTKVKHRAGLAGLLQSP